MISGINIWDFGALPQLWKKSKPELLVWFSSFVATLVLDVQYGIAIGVSVSILLLLFPIAFPHIFLLGRLSGLKAYRAVKIFPDSLVHPSIAIVRVDSPLCFLNVSFVTKFFRDLVNNSSYLIRVTQFPTTFFVLQLNLN